MNMCRSRFAVLLLSAPILTAVNAAHASGNTPIREIPDIELADMRGRFTVAGHGVIWFGISMVSTLITPDGKNLQGSFRIGLDFGSGNVPRLVLVPSLTLEMASPEAAAAGDGSRSVDGSGLQNVSGLVQSVQVAGDANVAHNTLRLDIRDGGAPAMPGESSSQGAMSVQAGAATAMAGIQGQAVRLQLQVAGQGIVEQWLRSGGIGQSIQLAADGQRASNVMNIELVRQPLAASPALAQNVAQAITLARGVGR